MADKCLVLASCLAERDRFQESGDDFGGRVGGENTDPENNENAEKNAEISELEAVGVGFEPTMTLSAMPVFKTGPFNHSGTPPAR